MRIEQALPRYRISLPAIVFLACLSHISSGGDAASGEDVRRVYDLGDLLEAPPRVPGYPVTSGCLIFISPDDGDESSLTFPRRYGYGPDSSVEYGAPDIELGSEWNDEGLHREFLLELLVVHLRALEEAAGRASEDIELDPRWASSNRFYLTASEGRHAAIAAFLDSLRRQEEARYHVECLFVPTAVLDGEAPAWRAEGPFLPEGLFDRLTIEKQTVFLAVTCRNGQNGTAGVDDVTGLIVDMEVNHTGVSPVVDARGRTGVGGDCIQVQPVAVPGDDAVRLGLTAVRRRVASERTKLGPLWSDLDLPVVDETAVSTSSVVPLNSAFVAGSLSGTIPQAVLARVRRTGRAAPSSLADYAGGRILRTFDVSLVHRDPVGRYPGPYPVVDRRKGQPGPFTFTEDVEDDESMRSPGEFWEYVADVYGVESLDEEETAMIGTWGDRIVVLGETRSLQEVGRLIDAETESKTHVAAVDVSRITAPRSFLAALRERTEDGFLLKAGWEKDIGAQAGMTWIRHGVLGMSGEAHALRDAKIRSLVTGANAVSGGTTYALIEVTDPTISTCGDGFEFTFQADLDPARPLARLRIDAAETKILELRSETIQYPSSSHYSAPGSRDGTATAGTAPAPFGRSVEISITLPRQSVRRWNVDHTLPLDRHAVLAVQAGPGETAEILIGRVRKVR